LLIYLRRLTNDHIGVLTKPDRIPTGEVANWLPFIRNEKEPLKNGWYCVKQPGSEAIKDGISWAQARKEEETFFAGWSEELDAVYHKHLTTSSLVERLSLILSDLISKRFCFLVSSIYLTSDL
jgi:Dynamin central region